MKRIMSRLCLVALALAPALAFGHGGEDHGEPAAASASTTPGADGRRTAYGQSAIFELLLKYAPPEPGHDASMLVFLSDYATNAPVENAKLELELTGAASVKTVAEPAGAPGTYHALAKLPPGKYSVVATIEGGGQLDLVEIKGVDMAPPPAPAHVAKPGVRVPWRLLGVCVGGLLALIIAISLVRRRIQARRGTTVAVLLLLIGTPMLARGHGGVDDGDEPPPKAGPPALPSGAIYVAKESQFLLDVRTVLAANRELEGRVETVGRVTPRVDGHAEIAAPLAGRIVPVGGKLPFIGDRVKKGQPLLAIEQTLGAAEASGIQSQAIQARSAIAQANATRDQRQRQVERLRSLKGVVAEKDIQQAELDLELASKDLSRAQQEAALFGGGGLRRVTITAPLDGVIAEADVSVGAQVAADKRLYTIIEPTTLWVEAEVFEADLARVEQLGAASIRVEGYPDSFPGKLYRLGQVVDPNTRTVKAIFAVDNAKGSLRPGMFAQVAIGAGGKTAALAIPDAAVVEDGGRRFAFVHVRPEEFVRRELVLGARDGDFWAVKAGLAAGDRVVVQGTYQLRTAH